MNTFKKVLIYVLLFCFSFVLYFFFEDPFHRLVWYLYEALSSHRISFYASAKYIYFTNGVAPLFFGLYSIWMYYLLSNQNRKQRIKSISWSLLCFVVTLIFYCAIDAQIKLATCTACQDGMRVLHYSQINYEQLFAFNTCIALIPAGIISFKKQ